MAGRPTKLTNEVRRKLEQAAALDCTVEEIALFAGIHRDTLHTWMAADQELADRITELRDQPVLDARGTVVAAIKKNPEIAFRYLERKRKKEFAEQKQLTGADGQPLFDDKNKEKAKGAIASFFGN